MATTAESSAIVWDGVNNSYIPSQKLNIDPSVRLHTETADVIDPITYEVLRHALWNVNDEHGLTIEQVSGSPFANEAHDFNTVILTEDGEYVFFGPHIQFFSGVMDLPIKWTLENLGRSPGIRDGDMFLSNDPWIGAVHQSDVQLTCPVFWDGRIFCWVANSLHQYDIGGNTPGSFCADAQSVFDEPVPIPPSRSSTAARSDQIWRRCTFATRASPISWRSICARRWRGTPSPGDGCWRSSSGMAQRRPKPSCGRSSTMESSLSSSV